MNQRPLTSHHLSGIVPLHESIKQMSATALTNLLKAAVNESGLDVMADIAVDFAPHGASAVVVLKESHVAVHIWPEHESATIDIHVCDYMSDNLSKARLLAQALSKSLAGDCLQEEHHWNELTMQQSAMKQ
ncbi:MAG: S-adenosylmethionine decarboxylase [Candidatus Obscuribacterales bacterium]|nr:S-adenosylmethionine decarboxylase [Candidatus Obscuribacterales bacterium]